MVLSVLHVIILTLDSAFNAYFLMPLSESCCSRVQVKASGFAKRDQGPYLGTYSKIADYNGRHAYEMEGSAQLYVYFYSSQVRYKIE